MGDNEKIVVMIIVIVVPITANCFNMYWHIYDFIFPFKVLAYLEDEDDINQVRIEFMYLLNMEYSVESNLG